MSLAELPSAGEKGKVSGGDAFVRRLYGLVLWICCAYYYVSLPVVILLVLGAAAGLIYGFMAVGHIPIKLVVIVALPTIRSGRQRAFQDN